MPLEKRTLACLFATIAIGLCACAGCYDGTALLREARSTARDPRLAEVDFGKYQTTLPRDEDNNAFTELNLHIFGIVPRYQVSAVKKQLKADEYRLRHETLAAIRKATREELAEPSLAKLRARIEGVVNTILSDAPVTTIGFYQVTLRQG